MRLIHLHENQTSVTAYHGGGNFDFPDIKFLGSGENNHVLGPGIYFATNPRIAKRYMSYSSDPRFYQCTIDMSRIYDPVKGLPEEMRGIGDRMAESLGMAFDDLPRAVSLKYGKWPVGPFVQHLGVDKALELFRKFDLNGLYENLPGNNGMEIAVYDTAVVSNFKKIEAPE